MIIDITVTLLTATATATAVNDIAVTVVLNDEVVNPESTFCERVDDCLDIPSANGNYVLKILNGVKSWVSESTGGGVWGSIIGTITNQTDLVNYITTRLTGYATEAFVTTQGYITNVVTALGYTPENVANKSDSYTLSSSTTYASTKALVDGLATKGSGTVTSVSALTLGTNGTDLSSTVSNGTTTPVITLNVPTASATNRGALSSTDWSTFNSKQDYLTAANFGSFINGLIGKTSPVDADSLTISDSADSNNAKKVSITNLWANYLKGKADAVYQAILTAANFGTFINGLSSKTTPSDADTIPIKDSADSNNTKALSFTNLKTWVFGISKTRIVAASTTTATTTNNAETILHTLTIPANTFTENDFLYYEMKVYNSATSGTNTYRCRVSTSAAPVTISSQTLLATVTQTGVAGGTSTGFARRPKIISTGVNDQDPTVTANQHLGNSAYQNPTDVSVDWTVTQYLHFTSQKTASGTVTASFAFAQIFKV